jgi:hypothetical protein
MEYSKHAKRQIKIRKITKEEIEYCLEHENTKVVSIDRCTIYYAEHPNGKKLKIVVDKETGKIVTAAIRGK